MPIVGNLQPTFTAKSSLIFDRTVDAQGFISMAGSVNYQTIVTLAAGEMLRIQNVCLNSVVATPGNRGTFSFHTNNVDGNTASVPVANLVVECQSGRGYIGSYPYIWSAISPIQNEIHGPCTVYMSIVSGASNNQQWRFTGTVYKNS